MKSNQTLNKATKLNKLNRVLALSFLLFIIFAPGIAAYPLGLPALDLYTALVDYVFGSFWLAVLFLIAIMFFILTVMGNISAMTSFEFILFFFYAISIGYSPVTAIFAFVILTSWTIFQVVRYGNQASY